MEASQLSSVRKFVRQTLNLSDAAKISDFGLIMNNGVMTIEAKIRMEVSYEEFSSVADVPLTPAQRNKYLPAGLKKKVSPSRLPREKGSYSANREFSATASDFHAIRVILRGWRKIGKLNENEVEVMVGYARTFFATMNQETKQNFLDFFHAVRLRLSQKEALAKKES